MKYVSYIVAIATLTGAVAGCGSPYYSRSGYSQGYSQQPSYGYYQQPSYGYQQPNYSYYSPGYGYR
jgi:hypothetical protein